MILPVSLLFHNIGHNLAQILPQDHTQFDFFCWFSMKYVNWGPHGPRPKQNKNFFSEMIKTDPKLSKPFYFNKIPYVLAEL